MNATEMREQLTPLGYHVLEDHEVEDHGDYAVWKEPNLETHIQWKPEDALSRQGPGARSCDDDGTPLPPTVVYTKPLTIEATFAREDEGGNEIVRRYSSMGNPLDFIGYRTFNPEEGAFTGRGDQRAIWIVAWPGARRVAFDYRPAVTAAQNRRRVDQLTYSLLRRGVLTGDAYERHVKFMRSVRSPERGGTLRGSVVNTYNYKQCRAALRLFGQLVGEV